MSAQRASLPDSRPAPPAVRVARGVAGALARRAWLWFALACVLLAYAAVWQRGSLTDDYTHRLWLIDAATGRWAPIWGPDWLHALPTRALTIIAVSVYSALLPTHELAVRLLAALLVGANALLLGLLVWRLLRARVPAIVAGWLFTAPLYAHEAVLWASAVGYVLGTALALGFLHACLSALQGPRAVAWRWGLLSAALFGPMLLFVEQFALAAALIPLLALAWAGRSGGRAAYGRALGRAALLLLPPAGLTLFVYRTMYRGSWVVAARGGLDLSPAGIWQRAVQYTLRLGWITVWPERGGRLTREALALGLETLAASPAALSLLAVAVIALVATLLRSAREGGERPADRHKGTAGALWCLGLGLAWGLLPVYLPGVIVSGQQIEHRMLYFPLAGLATALGALASLVLRAGARPSWERGLLAATGVLALLSSVAMLGYARVYAARGAHDARQVAAFVAAVDDDLLVEGVVLVPTETDEHHLDGYPALGTLLQGVFETPWSTADGVGEAYGRNGLSAVAGNRWAPLTVTEEDPAHLRALDTVVPIDRALLFAHRDGGVYVCEAVEAARHDGTTAQVALPLGAAAAEGGAPTIAPCAAP